MEKILFLAHTENGNLAKSHREVFQASLDLAEKLSASELSVGLVGEQVEDAARTLASDRVCRFLAVTGETFGPSRYATDTAAAEALCKDADATLILAAGTSRWNRCLPGVAFRLGGRIDSHICGLLVENEVLSVARWYYRQRMKAVLESPKRPWILTLDPGIFKPFENPSGSVSVEKIEVSPESAEVRSRVTGVVKPTSGAETIRPDADLLFVAGAGWTKTQSDGKTHLEEAEKHILDFLENAQASLGGSKSMVELSSEGQQVLSFMTHLNQIGQTGSTPRHPKGLATCCHGEEPHTVGWRFINERRAVNLDPNCGWAQGKADVLYVGDAFEIMAKVNRLLAE